MCKPNSARYINKNLTSKRLGLLRGSISKHNPIDAPKPTSQRSEWLRRHERPSTRLRVIEHERRSASSTRKRSGGAPAPRGERPPQRRAQRSAQRPTQWPPQRGRREVAGCRACGQIEAQSGDVAAQIDEGVSVTHHVLSARGASADTHFGELAESGGESVCKAALLKHIDLCLA